ncbi:hypothetical protein GALMADRAFT_147248 [Galerina marginata CBS 339.88]|uniref:Uncharacterized protein n=1 Tax=Galerina marginata (strain CBS 339.88) TaxID=685588 RepID=A0A067SBA4_GALM3|nr:hypothetical protein GALMADRAFT_147248 [Galerina marginata CBS 339.88]
MADTIYIAAGAFFVQNTGPVTIDYLGPGMTTTKPITTGHNQPFYGQGDYKFSVTGTNVFGITLKSGSDLGRKFELNEGYLASGNTQHAVTQRQPTFAATSQQRHSAVMSVACGTETLARFPSRWRGTDTPAGKQHELM